MAQRSCVVVTHTLSRILPTDPGNLDAVREYDAWFGNA
jgi:hypothetical protein